MWLDAEQKGNAKRACCVLRRAGITLGWAVLCPPLPRLSGVLGQEGCGAMPAPQPCLLV